MQIIRENNFGKSNISSCWQASINKGVSSSPQQGQGCSLNKHRGHISTLRLAFRLRLSEPCELVLSGVLTGLQLVLFTML